MKKILKSSGYCSDGCQWSFCDFYRTEETGETRMVQSKDGEFVAMPYHSHHCDLFGVQLHQGCLFICDKVYGKNYEGYP